MAAREWGEVKDIGAMISLLILAMIGAGSGGIGGALTNGLDGFVLGSCAGFLLGIVAWITENLAEQRKQELSTSQVPLEAGQRIAPVYDQSTPYHQPTERTRS